LEQRSPLNIYVEEADWHFNEMRKNVAHQIIISFHRLYIPKINEELHNNLAKVLPERQLDAPKKIENQDITNILNTRPNFKIDASPKLPKDRPYVSPDQKASDAKEQLLEKMHQAQNANKLNDDKK
jgi:hypothetical protein